MVKECIQEIKRAWIVYWEKDIPALLKKDGQIILFMKYEKSAEEVAEFMKYYYCSLGPNIG
ncbi:MAG: hypothetical protein PHC34_11620 [Candidatus Gastranaerophilales bacterium]|nr:hypothetical protein [Candidatus Gastranaerophilales bacterium]